MDARVRRLGISSQKTHLAPYLIFSKSFCGYCTHTAWLVNAKCGRSPESLMTEVTWAAERTHGSVCGRGETAHHTNTRLEAVEKLSLATAGAGDVARGSRWTFILCMNVSGPTLRLLITLIDG